MGPHSILRFGTKTGSFVVRNFWVVTARMDFFVVRGLSRLWPFRTKTRTFAVGCVIEIAAKKKLNWEFTATLFSVIVFGEPPITPKAGWNWDFISKTNNKFENRECCHPLSDELTKKDKKKRRGSHTSCLRDTAKTRCGVETKKDKKVPMAVFWLLGASQRPTYKKNKKGTKNHRGSHILDTRALN